MCSRSRRALIAILTARLCAIALSTLALAGCEPHAAQSEKPRPPRSQGCGRAAANAGVFIRQELRIADHTRSYHLRLPSDYEPERAYPMIFRFHGHGGNGLSGGLEIERSAGASAIIVAADGLHEGWSEANEDNDLALFDALHEALSARYCVDLRRVYAYGFSMGGGFVNLLSCLRADKLRASAAIAAVARKQRRCGGPLAAWLMHDRDDTTVPLREGLRARERMRARNQCGAQATQLTNGCLRYEGCHPGAPVVWCETRGLGHSIDGDNAPERVWDFFRGLP
jgi:poly(3-hydroxybutyrate) depolymerase